MADKQEDRSRKIDIRLGPGTFSSLFRHFGVGGKEEKSLNFSDISMLRQLLSNEKARILYTLQHKKPSSIYELAKLLERDFKSVRMDLELLKQFGFIRFQSESKGKRRMLKPILNITKLDLSIHF
ncbi:hypothetical protein HZA33_01045 [Candidatus Pacearchaeota archaeon]|nr:hypothetical protein [Candidatus Pacearchaeota archaeon]